MSKTTILKVNTNEIPVINVDGQDFFLLTSMTNGFKEGSALIGKWISNKNTLEYLAIWETLNNQNLNYPEIEVIKKEAGSNRFIMSVGQWISRTGANGFLVKAGKYGGTYAHKDIAFHFAMWLSPQFQLLIIKEYQVLKDKEAGGYHIEWYFRRFLTKANYKLHTDSIKEKIIPYCDYPEEKEWLVYAEEADLLNKAVFGCTAKQWKEQNPELTLRCENLRDCADSHQLMVLANLESLNATLIRRGVSKEKRFEILCKEAIFQLQSLYNGSSDITAIQSPHITKTISGNHSGFDLKLKGLMSVPPPKKKKDDEENKSE